MWGLDFLNIKSLIACVKSGLKFILYRSLHFVSPDKSNVVLFSEEVLEGKRVIIIGPAETALSYMSGSEIDNFDFVVRVNKAPLLLEGLEDKIGSRTDILYHCFSEDPINGGGKIDIEILKKQGNKYIIYSYAEPLLESEFYKTVMKHKGMSFYRVKKHFFNNLKKDYSAKWPTTGLQAIIHLMSCDFKELHVTGFTFFRTRYLAGYTENKINESEESMKEQIEKKGSHNFEDELNLFKKHYALNKDKNIYLDSFIKQLIS